MYNGLQPVYQKRSGIDYRTFVTSRGMLLLPGGVEDRLYSLPGLAPGGFKGVSIDYKIIGREITPLLAYDSAQWEREQQKEIDWKNRITPDIDEPRDEEDGLIIKSVKLGLYIIHKALRPNVRRQL